MSKRFTKALWLIACVGLLSLLAACAGTPTQESSEQATTPKLSVEVDATTRAAYKKALNAMQNGQDQSAIAQFKAISQSQPNLAAPFTNIGLILIKQKRYEQAEKALLQATTLRPDDAVAQTHLGVAYRHLGKFKEAEAAYTAALKSNPKYPFAHLNAGILYDIYLNEPQRALNHYQQYQSISGSNDKQVENWIIELERRLKGKS